MNAITVRHNCETLLAFEDSEAISVSLKVGVPGVAPIFEKAASKDDKGVWSMMLTIPNINGIPLGTYKYQFNVEYPELTFVYPDPTVPGNEVLPDFIVLDSID